ncbi:lytic polysaccharide monooxygenase [Streptomyces caniscabiei]|uniref:Lytic polysaccharide monooxygenase n=1 Tax=Streptomyces caniscabiei TaxID=2746961 RepID=A0A927QNU3_9ACTN|nr:lytic polysaccharide monooxygenase [Streptomyces caniscabiei]MBD9728277.1 lytic polysaccharide monooxygenase [Streptomyces caniscabiei]MDX3509859.1 lytic polysaccharide monooxygenase [Streptomyces caniscabiei]MDX3723585.1 lytic polysaccharide monooxygenase [Streptomyces caniscabiei]WEO28061.1 lytic polysaccharide monooxygenase [Streptomyces caniscabiei]
MPAARRQATASAAARVVGARGAAGVVPLALAVFAAGPAVAHGALGDPVSRVAQCYAEGPESPRSAACAAAVAAGGTQALYDWNGVRIGDAAGRHRELIPDGELCSAGDAAFKGLDLARADWPSTRVRAGSYPFAYRVTAPHKGTFTVYVTKEGYDPSRPLAWDDLDLANPVARATDPAASGGFYRFSGTLPQRSGRQLLYAVWQRSDSPEAFYSCSDVSFGGGGAGGGSASAPSEEQIEEGADESTVEHGGHGDDDARTTTDPTTDASAQATGRTAARGSAGTASDDVSPTAKSTTGKGSTTGEGPAAGSGSGGLAEPAGGEEGLADTGGDGTTPYLALGGAAVLALGSSLLFAAARRRATAGGRHGR